MSVPQHGLNCRTHTFPTTCNHCGDAVFFFSFTCGSRVFLDDLGWPWPEHDCAFSKSDRQWAQGRRRTKLPGGGVCVEISDGVTATRPGERRGGSWNLDPEVAEVVKREVRLRESHPIERVPPGADWTVEVVGVVRELNHPVDVYQYLKLPRTAMSKSLLGDLGSGEWGRVTIHELGSVIYSYTAWVPMLPQRPRIGGTVSARLRRFDALGGIREWICEHFLVE